MNIANKLTMLRVALIPVFLIVLYWGFPFSQYVALAIFIIASLTDYVDGYLARSRNLVTDFGKFMDPLADKILVITAMLWFVQTGVLPAWAVAIVILREFAVSGMRLIAVEKGTVVAAGMSGKVKTVLQMITIIYACVFQNVLGLVLSIVSAALTVYSGAEYFFKLRHLFQKDFGKN